MQLRNRRNTYEVLGKTIARTERLSLHFSLPLSCQPDLNQHENSLLRAKSFGLKFKFEAMMNS